MEREGDPPFLYRWKCPEVQPGRYEAELHEFGFSVVLNVGSDGLPDAGIEVPPPADVHVRCIDASTGLNADGVSVAWRYELPPSVTSWGSVNAAWNDSVAKWVSRTPIGKVILSVSGDDYVGKHETVEFRLGMNEFVLVVQHKTGLRVVLRDGLTQIPWGNTLIPILVADEGQESLRSMSQDGRTVTLIREEGGRYKLKIPEIPGYEPVPEQVVRLEKGVVKEHVIELVRRP
jgi:hypothetical protein